jgi:hypothetical protein
VIISLLRRELVPLANPTYMAAVQILSQCWKYGEELKNWNNEKYNY